MYLIIGILISEIIFGWIPIATWKEGNIEKNIFEEIFKYYKELNIFGKIMYTIILILFVLLPFIIYYIIDAFIILLQFIVNLGFKKGE